MLSVLIASLAPTFAVVDTGVVLGSHIVNSNHIQLRLSCEPDVTYALQSTSDFQNWFPVLTNSDPETLRSFDLETTNAQTFYRVSRRPLPLFGAALVALDVMDLNGFNITTDSYDSADPNHSINGLYPVGQTNMIKSNGDIMAGLKMVDSVGVGNARILGKVRTGPDGTANLGTNGYATGGIHHNFNIAFPNVTLPSGVWIPVLSNSITVNGMTYPYRILSAGDYLLNGLNSSLYIASNVNCRIRITGNVALTGVEEIRIAYGATVKLYMQGASFKTAGNGIVNDNGYAASFYYFGLPSNTSIQLAGNGGFVGAIYAPQAAFALGGAGSDLQDSIGASVTKSVQINGHFNFHFDEHLKRIGPFR
jgi:hypothetical protein